MPRGKPRQPRIPMHIHRTYRLSVGAVTALQNTAKKTGRTEKDTAEDFILATWAALRGETGTIKALAEKLDAAAAEHAAAQKAAALKAVTAKATAAASARLERLTAAKRKAS